MSGMPTLTPGAGGGENWEDGKGVGVVVLVFGAQAGTSVHQRPRTKLPDRGSSHVALNPNPPLAPTFNPAPVQSASLRSSATTLPCSPRLSAALPAGLLY